MSDVHGKFLYLRVRRIVREGLDAVLADILPDEEDGALGAGADQLAPVIFGLMDRATREVIGGYKKQYLKLREQDKKAAKLRAKKRS